MNEKFLQQVIAELVSAQKHAMRVFASAVADTCGDREELAKALEFHSARLQHAEPHPMAEEWIEAVTQDLRGKRGG